MKKLDSVVFVIEAIETAKILETDVENAVWIVESGDDDAEKVDRFYKKLLYEFLQRNGLDYPATLASFLQLLKKPIVDWGIFCPVELEEEGIPLDLIIIDSEIGISEEAEELLREFQSSSEATSKLVQEVLSYCRRLELEGSPNMDKLYVAFRIYLILNPTTNEHKLELYCFENKFDPYIASALHRCYENIPNGFQFKCQSCGWPLKEKTKNYYVCLKKECRDKYDATTLENYKLNSTDTLQVKESIQLSTVIPGLKELELVARLEKAGAKVDLYPNLERLGDVKASKEFNNIRLQLTIDVKDYRYPKQLAKKLLVDFEQGMLKCPIIAVPDPKATKRYLQYVNDRLLENDITSVKVFSFKQVVAMFNKDSSMQLYARKFYQPKGEQVNV